MNNLIITTTTIFIVIQTYHLQASVNCKDLHIIFEALPQLEIPSEPIPGIAFRTEQDRAQFSPHYSKNAHMLNRFSPSKLSSAPGPTKEPNILRKSAKSSASLQDALSVEHNITAISTIHILNDFSCSLENNKSDTVIDHNLNWYKSLSKEHNFNRMPALHASSMNMEIDNSYDSKPPSPYGSPTKNSTQKSWASYVCCCFFYQSSRR